MSGVELLLLAAVALAGAGAVVAGIAALVSRGRGRRNRVVPEVATNAPTSWAGAHTPLARLHRRLRAAVAAVRGVPDPDGALIAARVEIEHAALAVDDHLVALHLLSERERAGRMAPATAAVASVEEAAATLADAAAATHSRALPAVGQAVAEALERAALVAEARRELDADPVAILDDASIDGPLPDAARDDDEPQAQPGTG